MISCWAVQHPDTTFQAYLSIVDGVKNYVWRKTENKIGKCLKFNIIHSRLCSLSLVRFTP